MSATNFFDSTFVQIYNTQAGVIRGTNINTNNVQALEQTAATRKFRKIFENANLAGNYVNLGLVSKMMSLGKVDKHGIMFWDNVGVEKYTIYVDPAIFKICGMNGELSLLSSDIGVYLSLEDQENERSIAFVILYQKDEDKSCYSYYIPKNS